VTENVTKLNGLPDANQVVWRLRYHTKKQCFTTYHHSFDGLKRQVIACIKNGFNLDTLSKITVELYPHTLLEIKEFAKDELGVGSDE
jgi:hypothetical protein